MRLIALGVAVGIALAACRQEPLVPPPKPTNPTNGLANGALAQTELDASIVSDASPSLDAASGAFDAPPPTR